MRKAVGTVLILILVILLFPRPTHGTVNNKWKPDWSWYFLAGTSFVLSSWDTIITMNTYRHNRLFYSNGYSIKERNPIARYFLDNCPWGLPVYMIGGVAIVVVASYFMNKLGINPLGHIILGGLFLAEGYAVYINLKI